MKSATLLMTSAAILAFALAGPAAAKSGRYMRSHAMAQDQYMRSNAATPFGPYYGQSGYYAQANMGCFKETNKDWGFGYTGECAPGTTAANISRLRDQRQIGGQ